jgi:hypothetical protein
LDFLSTSDSGLGIRDLLSYKGGLFLIFGDHLGVVCEDLLNLLSLSESLFMGCNQNVLKVNNLHLIFSLVLKSGGSIIDSSGSNVSLYLCLFASILLLFKFLVVLVSLFLDGGDNLLFN